MNVDRIVTGAAALVVTAAQWLAFAGLFLLLQPAQITAASTVGARHDASAQEVVISATRLRS